MSSSKYNYVRVTATYKGKQYEGWGKSHEEAQKKLDAKINAVKRGDARLTPEMKVSLWAEIWLTEYQKPKVRKPGSEKRPGTMSEKSYKSYDQIVRNYIVPAIGNRPLGEVTEPELRRILNKDSGNSFSHASKLRMTLKGLFGQATASRIISFDPSAHLEMPAVEKGTRRSLTDYEREVFFQVAEKHKHGHLFRFLLATGIRPNELRALKVGNLDLKKGIVRIDEAVESGSNAIGSPKTKAGYRYTVINDADLVKWLKKTTKGKDADSLLFTQSDNPGQMITETSLRVYWRSFSRAMDLAMGAECDGRGHIYDPKDLKADGTPLYPDPKNPKQPRNGHKIATDLVLYCLRHTFGTDMQRKGVPVEVTKYLMGHEDISTTSNIYIDSGEPEALRAVSYITGKNPTMGKNMGKSK